MDKAWKCTELKGPRSALSSLAKAQNRDDKLRHRVASTRKGNALKRDDQLRSAKARSRKDEKRHGAEWFMICEGVEKRGIAAA